MGKLKLASAVDIGYGSWFMGKCHRCIDIVFVMNAAEYRHVIPPERPLLS